MNRTFLRACFWLAISWLTASSLSLCVWGQEKSDRNDDPLPKGAIVRLGTSRFRQSEIDGLAMSPDGKLLASANWQGLTLWDLATGKKRALFADELDYSSLAFADEGRTLITVDAKGKLRYRDSASGQIKHDVALTDTPDDWGYENCFMTRNGHFFAFADRTGKTVCVWDLTARKEIARIKTKTYPIGLSEDGRYLAHEPERGGALEVWDISKSKAVTSISHDAIGYLNKLGFSPDGKTLMSLGTHSHGTRSWDIETGKLRQAYGSSPRETYEFAFSNDGKLLATLHEDAEGWGISVWDFASNKQLWRQSRVGFVGQSLVFTPDGQTLITASGQPDSIIRKWDVDSGTEIRQPSSADGAPRDLVSSPDGRWLTATSNADKILLWDLNSKTVVTRFAEAGHYANAAFTPDSKQVAYPHYDGSVRLCETASGNETLLFPKRNIDRNRQHVTGLAISADGKVLMSACADWILATWSVTDAKRLDTIHFQNIGVSRELPRSLQFSPDASVVTTTYRRKQEKYHLWNSAKGERLGVPEYVEGAEYEDLVLAPDGRTFAVTLRGSSVRIYDALTGAEQRVLVNPVAAERKREKEAFSGPLAYSPDGRILATVCDFEKSSVDLWDVATGEHLQHLETLQDGVSGMTFVGTGNLLATGGSDTTILLWDVGDVRRKR